MTAGALAAAAGLTGLTLAGCQSGNAAVAEAGAAATAQPDLAGTVLLAVPVELRELDREYPCGPDTTTSNPADNGTGSTAAPSGAAMRDLDGADCFQLSAPLLTVQRLTSIRLDNTSQPGESVIDLGLTEQDAAKLGALTGGLTGKELAVVVRGTVLATPMVTGRTTSLQIADDFTENDAQRVMRQITG